MLVKFIKERKKKMGRDSPVNGLVLIPPDV